MPNKVNTFPFNIKKPCYSMALLSENEAEISMYGEIVETRPVDWWTGEPVEGDFIIQNEFLSDLEQITSSGTKRITLRMNSTGGDAGVSIVIHNRLRELINKGIDIKCVVDGVAMSGGSLIMCACNNVEVNPSSLIMIHKCWSFVFGGYNADDLREKAKQNDAWDKAQIAIYTRKSGLSDTVISHMMSETTYMTGKEAVEKGFADKILEDAEPLEIAASANGKSIFVSGKELHLFDSVKMPSNIPVVSTVKTDDINKKSADNADNSKGGTKIMAKNFAELRTEDSELAEQVEKEIRAAVAEENTAAVQAAIESERNRIKEIDSISSLYANELVEEAKYGKTSCSAQELAYRAAQKAAQTGSAFMASVKSDYANSGAKDVSSADSSKDDLNDSPESKMTDARASIKNLLHKGDAKNG